MPPKPSPPGKICSPLNHKSPSKAGLYRLLVPVSAAPHEHHCRQADARTQCAAAGHYQERCGVLWRAATQDADLPKTVGNALDHRVTSELMAQMDADASASMLPMCWAMPVSKKGGGMRLSDTPKATRVSHRAMAPSAYGLPGMGRKRSGIFEHQRTEQPRIFEAEGGAVAAQAFWLMLTYRSELNDSCVLQTFGRGLFQMK